MSPATIAKPPCELINHLLLERDVKAGFSILDDFFLASEMIEGDLAEQMEFLFCLAQWVDLGHRDLNFMERRALPFAGVDRLELPFRSVLQLMLIDAFA